MSAQEKFAGWAILDSEPEWRPVVGFEGLYEVSSMGQVRRIGPAARGGHGHGGGARLGRVVRQHMIPGGYWHVQMWRRGGPKTMLVHRIVAAAFIGPLPEGREINHLDGDKANNAATNLEYVTRSENLEHAYRIGLRKRMRNGAKLTPDLARRIREDAAAGYSQRTLGRRYGVARITIRQLLAGKTWKEASA